MIESAPYQRIIAKIHTILPESSIIGMMLEHQENYEVVCSTHSGIQQHDPLSWEVLGTSFVYKEDVAAQSILLNEAMKAWIDQLNWTEREQIVETIFDMLDEVGIKTVDDFYHSKWKSIQALLQVKNKLSPERQQLFQKAVKLLWVEGNKAMRRMKRTEAKK